MIQLAKIFNKNVHFYGFDLFENINFKKKKKSLVNILIVSKKFTKN